MLYFCPKSNAGRPARLYKDWDIPASPFHRWYIRNYYEMDMWPVFFFSYGEGTNKIIAMKDLLLFDKRLELELYLTGIFLLVLFGL
jgi:hypothetical protein